MRAADLTPARMAHLLDAGYRQDRGGDGIGLTLEQRTSLADYLGCHHDVRDAAWTEWRTALEAEGMDLGDAEYWLDVEFIEPCPQEQEA